MPDTISYPEARDLVAAAVRPLGTETLPLAECCGRVLAGALVAAEPVPAFDRSPYDGYAVRSADTQSASRTSPVTLRVLEEIPAGAVPQHAITPGAAARIMTGAPIPDGADAVVMYEKTEFTPTQVTLFSPLRAGSNIVRAGEDVQKGAVLAPAAIRIDAGLLGTLASQNRAAVSVFRVPRVALLSTGSELATVGQPALPGQVHDSNAYTLLAALQKAGCTPVPFGIVPDRTEAIAAALDEALQRCDAVVLTGGVSVGDFDLTPDAMEAVGVSLLFRGCAIKPGMACAYGVRAGKLVCALSGNPASSVTNFHLLAAPALAKLCGVFPYLPEEITVRLADGFPKPSPCTRLLRGRLDLRDGTARMHLPKAQGNVVLSSTIGCDVLAIVPAGSGPLEAGTPLKGLLL